jgi:N-acetylmuramoyl-L-alanine amidase
MERAHLFGPEAREMLFDRIARLHAFQYTRMRYNCRMRNLLWLAVYAGAAASFIVLGAAPGAAPLGERVRSSLISAQTAAVFFVQSITAAQIRDDYAKAAPAAQTAEKVRILIVPGHQPESGGTEFDGVYERDIAVDIALALAQLLRQNPHYEVMVSRTKTEWNPILSSYFSTHALEIQTFTQSQKAQMAEHLAQGSIIPEADQVYHNATRSDAAMQLYGINKWTSDNGYDITLHLHVNDYAGRRSRAGAYDGFAIYVPDDQYSNAAASRAVAEAIAARLSAYHAKSTLPKEDRGIVEDQQLIATGSYNTADNAALLIEYGYIYEPQFQNASVLPLAVADYAYQTYLGLQDFFQDPVTPTFGSISFPYDWERAPRVEGNGPSVYALQAALRHLGFYPPAYTTFSDCPVSGRAGPCTRAALAAYQNARGIAPEHGLGRETRAALSRDLAQP